MNKVMKFLKRKDLLFIFLLMITLFGLYWKTFNYDLIWDSKNFLENNPFFKENSVIDAFKVGYLKSPLAAKSTYYRPVVTASFLMEEEVWGLKNWRLRLVNLFVYTVSLIFWYFFLKYQSEKKYFAELTTLLFALNPLNVDNVVWVVGRCDLFLILWGSLTFLFLELYRKKGKYLYLVFSSLFYGLGIFSKEAFVFFLPILILYEIIRRKKTSISYHLINISITILFFFIKIKILEIGNLKLLFYRSFIKNLLLLLASTGYYFRSMIFPFYYDMFLPESSIMNWKYISLGVLFIFFFIFILYKSKRDTALLIPLSLIFIFLCGHISLVFSLLFAFKIYSRYMMIPSLGLAWIFVHFMGRMKERKKILISFLVLIAFIPSVILNARSYRNELIYFQRAAKSVPENDYFTYQLAKVYHEKKKFIASELYLNRALSFSIRKQTAMLVSLLYSDLELLRASYDKSLKWLQSIEPFEAGYWEFAPFIKFQKNHQEGLIHLIQGDFERAEKLFKENLEKYPESEESAKMLYDMYVGQNLWEKAKNFETSFRKKYEYFSNIDTERLEEEFQVASLKEKIGFYLRYRNFIKAIELLQGLSPLSLDDQILLARLYYRAGRQEEGKEVVEEILKKNPDNAPVLNRIGNFYLDFIRIEDAVFYFKKSLEVNNDQPNIAFLVNNLTENYIKKITDPWKEGDN